MASNSKEEPSVSSHLDALRCGSAVAAIALGTFLFHLIAAKGYGYFRDELYYLASTEHLDFGYVEHPPLVVVIAWITRRLLGDSLYAVRFFPALAAGATVYLSAAITRQLGGGGWARAVTALAVALAPGYIGLFSILTMNAFDIVFWTSAMLVLILILKTGDVRLWAIFGVIAGMGLENKISILFLGFGIVVGIILTRDWRHFRSKWFWLAGVISFAFFLPHLIWQQAHGWPTLEFIHNATTYKNLPLSPWTFLSEQVLQMNPAALPLWVAGLGFLLFAERGRPYRALGWAYLAVLVVMITQNAKPYYLVPIYPILFASGAFAFELMATRRPWRWIKPATPAILVVSGILLAPLAKALLPVDVFVRYAATLGIGPRTEERNELGRLPQHFADMHGWQEMASSVGDVYQGLTPGEQAQACLFGQNYGEAGAIDLFGQLYGLPPAISGHNSYYLWGPGDCTGEIVIVMGDDREQLEGVFGEVSLGGRFICEDCMPYENNLAIWVCRGLKLPLDQLWPQLKRFI